METYTRINWHSPEQIKKNRNDTAPQGNTICRDCDYTHSILIVGQSLRCLACRGSKVYKIEHFVEEK